MGAVVVYESMLGSTRAVAEAVAQGLSDAGVVARTVEVGVAAETVTDDVTLLVVGGPTHAFGMSRERTREDARQHSPDHSVISGRIGVREWLAGIDLHGRHLPVAAFATRGRSTPQLPGSAAKGIAKELRRHGGDLVSPARDFWITSMKGGLVEGELDAARAWGAALAVSSSD